MKKVLLAILVLLVSISLAGTSFAAKKKGYVAGTAGAGSITGVVSLKGAAPAPIMEDLNKGKNVDFCKTHPDTKEGGIRPRVKVVATGGKLTDTVVFIEAIDGGKPWGDFGKAAYDLRCVILFKKCLPFESLLKLKKRRVVF